VTVTAIVGGQFGSEGKGVLAARIAHRYDVAVRTGGPNAGHTFWHNGQVYKMRQIPCGWINPNCELILGAGAVVDPRVLRDEAKFVGRLPFIDKQAVILQPEFREEELDIVATIGSTGEGVGIARIAKAARNGSAVLAGEEYPHSSIDTVPYLWHRLEKGKEILLEGTQGSGLSLHHGIYPYVTSEDTNVAQLLANAGIAPDWLRHTLLVARTYPIRVGGPSGPLRGEVDWGLIPGHVTPEQTTVTKRQRRIGRWDHDLFMRAVMLNEPCGIVLTFADYMDPDIREKESLNEWDDELRQLMYSIEKEVPIVLIGVGGEQFTMIQHNRCAHGEIW